MSQIEISLMISCLWRSMSHDQQRASNQPARLLTPIVRPSIASTLVLADRPVDLGCAARSGAVRKALMATPDAEVRASGDPNLAHPYPAEKARRALERDCRQMTLAGSHDDAADNPSMSGGRLRLRGTATCSAAASRRAGEVGATNADMAASASLIGITTYTLPSLRFPAMPPMQRDDAALGDLRSTLNGHGPPLSG